MTESVSDTVLAFDFGLRRIGVAVGNRLTGGAQPLTVVSGENDVRRFEIITRLIAEWHPQRLVVGHPRHPDGTPHAMTARCERFARQLQGRYRLPVALVDERYSSVDAQSELREQQRAGSRRRGAAVRGAGGSDPLLDAEAAAVILRQYWSEAAVAAPSFSQP